MASIDLVEVYQMRHPRLEVTPSSHRFGSTIDSRVMAAVYMSRRANKCTDIHPLWQM